LLILQGKTVFHLFESSIVQERGREREREKLKKRGIRQEKATTIH